MKKKKKSRMNRNHVNSIKKIKMNRKELSKQQADHLKRMNDIQANQMNFRQLNEMTKIGNTESRSSDDMNIEIDNVSIESIKIQIDNPTNDCTPVNDMQQENEPKIESETNKNDTLSPGEQSTQITDENSDIDNQIKKISEIQSKTENNTKIPDLLITENNKPSNENKFLIALILLFKLLTFIAIKIIALFHPTKRNFLSPIDDPLLLLSAGEITERIKNGQLTCERVVSAYINRIETVQPQLNAVIDNCFEDALKKAQEIDEQLKNPKLAEDLKKLPLLGVPITCKDSISVKDLALTAGVKMRKGIKADKDATVITNLRSAGAIPLCLTNTPELLLWCDTENNLYGRTNNPYDVSRIVGGSSGGEGCLIAAAGSLVGVGSDVAGSIRIPSMFNGVFGHKTIMKYIPVDGMFPIPPERYRSFLTYGPICRYAKDLSLALKAMGGELTDELRLDEFVDFRKIKIYYMENDGGNPLTSSVDQRILNSMHKAIKYFEYEYGVQTEKINIAKFKYSLAYFGTVCVTEKKKIQDYVTHTGQLNVYWELMKSCFGKSEISRPILIQILNQSSPYCDPDSSSHKHFTEMLKELKPKVHDLLGDSAVLMMPTWPTIAPKHQTTLLRSFDATYTAIMNALEIPATHCPVGLTEEEGLPIGFTVAAGPGYDRISIAFAKEIEKAFNGWVSPTAKQMKVAI